MNRYKVVYKSGDSNGTATIIKYAQNEKEVRYLFKKQCREIHPKIIYIEEVPHLPR